MMALLRIAEAARGSVKLGVALAPAERRNLSGVLVAGVIVLAFGLAGCGRQAALDPPPGTAVTTTKTCATCAPAPAPEKPHKPFFLDWLL